MTDTDCPYCGEAQQCATEYCTCCGAKLPLPMVLPPQIAKSTVNVASPAFKEPITPTIENRATRIVFALVAAPIIGVVMGGVFFGWVAIGLTRLGLPDSIAGLLTLLGMVASVAAVAYVILSNNQALMGSFGFKSTVTRVADRSKESREETGNNKHKKKQ